MGSSFRSRHLGREARATDGAGEHHDAESKRVRGVQIYATVAGSGQLDVLTDNTAAAGSIRALGAWLAEASRIAAAFEVPVIAVQGARIHLLNYRPIDDDKKLARDAVLLAAAVRRMTVGRLTRSSIPSRR